MKGWRRCAIVLLGFVESLLFSGCLFGWSSLLHVLEQEGVYSHLCLQPNDNGTVTPSSFQTGSQQTTDPQATTHPANLRYSNDHPVIESVQGTSIKDLPTDATTNPSSWTSTDDTLLKGFSPDVTTDKSALLPSTSQPPQFYDNDIGQANSSTHYGDEEDFFTPTCIAQTTEMTLIYTVAAVLYGLTSILVGFSLDLCGLWFTRILASMMTTGGFLCLAFTSKEMSWLLWPALTLIALGTNQLRLSTFQFANLWPEHRTTVLIAYSSAYSISTTLFLLIQYGHGAKIPYQTIGLILAGISLLTFPPTLIMPIMRVDEHIKGTTYHEPSTSWKTPSDFNPNNEVLLKKNMGGEDTLPRIMKARGDGQVKGSNGIVPLGPFDEREPVYKETTVRDNVPLGISLWTLSAFFHTFWAFINFFLVLFYSATFIPWIHMMTHDPTVVAHYNEVCGLCALIAPIFIPIAGLVTDYQIRKASRLEDRVERLVLTMQAPAFTMAVATVFLLGTMVCKVFFTREAVYISLVLIAISRPFIVGSCTSYVQIRFYPTHFNRLNGIFMTVVSMLAMVQYPIILWMKRSTEDFVMIQLVLIGLLVVSLISPGHLMIKPLARKYARVQLKFRTDM